MSSLWEAPQARKSGLACYGARLRGALEGSPRRGRCRFCDCFSEFDRVLSITCAGYPSQKYLWGTLGAQVIDTRKGHLPQNSL